MTQTYRNLTTGDRGFREGDLIRLDRPNDPNPWMDFCEGKWELEKEHRELTQMQIASVAFAADQALQQVLGMGRGKDWTSVTDRNRVTWKKNGPGEDSADIRQLLYLSVLEALDEDGSN